MKIDIDLITADTHSSEYLMHKYWARKPHNVISECISKFTPSGGIIIDPFCGSGVTLREASLLGRECYGFDVNPIACLISNVLIDPPSFEKFKKYFDAIYSKVYDKYSYLYRLKNGKDIKYISHRIVAKCKCGEKLKKTDCILKGKKTLCPKCGEIVHFNLETMVDSEIFNISVVDDKNYKPSNFDIDSQKVYSNFSDDISVIKPYDFVFPTNRRILSFNGIKTSSFFTKRNFIIICSFAEEVYKIKDEQIKNALLLLLTGSMAQCSRLIAHRNNLATGGPAWSVPGFWIPFEHLETNPFIHIKARFNKFKNALLELNLHPGFGKTFLFNGDSYQLLSNKFSDLKADLIFLDPPYGDSVPYTEFSNIWNSILKRIPDSNLDISVSDRIDKNLSWSNYKNSLDAYMNLFSNHLKNDGKLLITFNNNEFKAWYALLSSLQNNNFVCKEVFYQIPAVISSKAQMSINSSYISDIYSIYSLDLSLKLNKDLSCVLKRLIHISNLRRGIIAKTILNRELIICWMENNIDFKLLEERDNLLNSIFNIEGNFYRLKEKYYKKTELLEDIVYDLVKQELKNGPIKLSECYKVIFKKTYIYGALEYFEFKKFLKRFICTENSIIGVI